MSEPSIKDVMMMQRIIMTGVIILMLVVLAIVVKITWPWTWMTWDNVIGGGLLVLIVSIIGFPFYVACRKGPFRSRF